MQQAYSKIYKYVVSDDSNITELQAIVLNIGQEMYAHVLTARSNVLCGHIPFYTAIFRQDKFMDIMALLEHKHWLSVLSEMEDGNTCLTESMLWHKQGVVTKLLDTVKTENPILYEQILDTKDHASTTLREMLMDSN
jgi:hypothetical protein